MLEKTPPIIDGFAIVPRRGLGEPNKPPSIFSPSRSGPIHPRLLRRYTASWQTPKRTLMPLIVQFPTDVAYECDNGCGTIVFANNAGPTHRLHYCNRCGSPVEDEFGTFRRMKLVNGLGVDLRAREGRA